MKIVLVTGGFDPLHSGHIAYFKAAKELGDYLVVGVNSDDWLTRKKGKPFMPFEERATIIENLSVVDKVIDFDDSDNTANDAIQQVLNEHNFLSDSVIFANGGDRTKTNIPEMLIDDSRLSFQFGVGGSDKKNSSSWILEDYKYPKTERPWGYYRVLFGVGNEVKLKELTVDPGKRLSMQKHKHRNELWFVSEGTATVNTIDGSTDLEEMDTLNRFDKLNIGVGEWHQLENKTKKPLRIIEIQYGDNCIEDDISRIGVSDDYGKEGK